VNATVLRPPGAVGASVLAAGLAALSAGAAVALGPAALVLPFALVAVAWLLRHPPVLLAAFLHVGIFKGEAVLRALPFDITAALGLLLAGVCVHRILEVRSRAPALGLAAPVLIIGVALALGLLWTPVSDYGTEKAAKFLTLTLLSAVSPFVIVEGRRDLVELLLALVGLALLAGVGSVVTESTGRYEFGGRDNTILTSRLICLGALVLVLGSGLLRSRAMRMAGPALALGLVAVAAGVGSRGPLLSLVLALLCVTAASVARSPRQLLGILLVVAAGVAVFPFVSLPETSRDRLERTVQNPYASVDEDGRSLLYDKALELTAEHPFRGIGTGGFFLYSYVLADQEERYPHNVFLELSSEVGLVPAVALALSVLSLLIALFSRAWAIREDRERRFFLIFVVLFLFNLFSLQFSGDINDNRTFWAMFGLAWLLALHPSAMISDNRKPAAAAR